MSDLELTKKAEAYVASQNAQPERFGETGLLTLQIDRNSRRSLAGSIEALIDMLDDLSPDCDLEDGVDAEPWLGWGGKGLPTVSWPQDGRGSMYDDRELEDEDGGDINDQPHDDTELEADDGEYDMPGFIWGGNEDGR